MNTILENSKNNMDIILVQEPPKSIIRCVPSHTDCKGTLSEAPVTLQYSRAGVLS